MRAAAACSGSGEPASSFLYAITAASLLLDAESLTTQIGFTDGVAVSTATLSIAGSANLNVAANEVEATIGDRTALLTTPTLLNPGVRGAATVNADRG